MMLILFAALQATAPLSAAPPPAPRPADAAAPTPAERDCLAQARTDPVAAERLVQRVAGVTPRLRQCLGLALVGQQRFAEGAATCAAAAQAAELAHDAAAANYWAQSGNAWLAGGEAMKARGALDAALAAGTLTGLQRGEAHLDRARALVALGDAKAARTDLDQALVSADDDPLAWLLSATLARRSGDLDRARADIAQALRRSPDDASVQLEAGNIAARSGDAEAARTAWQAAVRLAPDAPAGRSAANALRQFDTPEAAK
jgi:tetratricopeptide (TPR) repeat protein